MNLHPSEARSRYNMNGKYPTLQYRKSDAIDKNDFFTLTYKILVKINLKPS